MKVRLTRKLADSLDGVDLSKHVVGDVFKLPRREAYLLIAEGWAVSAETRRGPAAVRGEASDTPSKPPQGNR